MSGEKRLPPIFHLDFAPEHWTKLMTLRAMLGDPFPTTPAVYEGLDICLNRLHKYETFSRLAERVIPELPKDREELDRFGASRNLHSAEFGVVVEAMISELYGTCDGVREFLYALFPKVQGVSRKKNETVFRRAHENSYGPDFPADVRLSLADAYRTWFPTLRDLRRQIAHREGGSFHLDESGEKVVYWHGPSVGDKRLIIKDVMNMVKEYEVAVRATLESIAGHFVAQLLPKPRIYLCGLYQARLYMRMVAPTPNLTFNDGHCVSWDWFESEREFFCPLAERCGAYKRKWPGGYAAAMAAS